MNQRWILLTIIIFKFYGSIDIDEMVQWMEYCENDFQFCPNCFMLNDCERSLKHIKTFGGGFSTSINKLFGSRTIQLANWNSNGVRLPVVLKYLSNLDDVNRVKEALCRIYRNENPQNDAIECDTIWKALTTNHHKIPQLNELLKHVFQTSEWTDGISLCPLNSNIKEFIRTFNNLSNEATFWIQLLVNPELVILEKIQKTNELKHFVPKILDWCGFVIIEEFTGNALYEFYNHPMKVRILLAKQLLEASIAFSHGINGFR